MNVPLPPPPPPLPPASALGMMAAASLPPPPPPPTLLFSPEEEQAVQDALLTSCKLLEEARCIESEREANLMMATSMLAHHGQADVDVSNLPGGVQDAWALLSEASQRGISTTSATAVISAAMGGDSKLLRLQQMDMERDAGVPTNNTGNDAATLPIGQGQLGKVTTMTTLAACIRRTGSVSDTLAKERRSRDGKVLKNALQTAKSKLSLIDPLSAPTPSTSTHESMAATTNLWLNIMDRRLKEIRSYHAKNDQYMDATSASPKRTASLTTSRATSLNSKRPRLGNPAADGYDLASSVLESLEGIRDGTLFSAEEVMGKYLDLRPLYEEHAVPIKNLFTEVVQTDRTKVFGFSDFLAVLSKGEGGLIEGISESSKLKERKKYVRFLVALENYLQGFLKRTQPLLPETQVAQPAIREFINEWREKGGSLGWEAKPAEASMVMDDDEKYDIKSSIHGIDLSSYKSAGDLEKAVDGDALKAELTRLGLKCGGTVADRAKRLFMTKDTPLDQLPKKLFAKKTAPQGNDGSASASANVNLKNERRVDIAKREVIVVALLNQLKPTLEATMRRTERRETQTSREREKEIDEDLHGSAIEGPKLKGASNGEDSDDDSDEDGPIYNPKGVPLGWDGKPIPYWLFKLHGLNHFYQCEICGNESYRGRRNFETHFAEARHAFGMKSLGIPNTKHFHGVTRIEDALNLWEKLKDQLQEEQFDGSKEEEYEDSHGNVLSRATYEDLARQGLL